MGTTTNAAVTTPMTAVAFENSKSRALKRHENFNNMTKRFGCFSGRFRHRVEQFATCFEAVSVICQYQLEDDMPLFDVLIEDIMEED